MIALYEGALYIYIFRVCFQCYALVAHQIFKFWMRDLSDPSIIYQKMYYKFSERE